MRFDGFVGNADVKRQLSARVDRGLFPHALLIEGPVGSGRRTLARQIARAAVCNVTAGAEGDGAGGLATGDGGGAGGAIGLATAAAASTVATGGESGDEGDGAGGSRPCGVCPACRKALAGAHPDIEEYGGDTSARSFHIDTVRALRENAFLAPNEAPYRVILLYEAQAMTEQAQNALLKILEEPPAHLLCILTCQNRAQLLPTIQSRLLCLTLQGVTDEEALPVLRQRLPQTPEESLRRALRIFGGCIGQALAGLEGDTLQEVLDLTPQLALAVAAPTELSLLRLTGRLEAKKDAVDGVLTGLILIFRDSLALLCQEGQPLSEERLLSTSPEAARTLAGSLTRAQLMRLIAEVQRLQQARLRNINHTLFLTLLCARLRAATEDSSIAEVPE